jgi:hypothetical protein
LRDTDVLADIGSEAETEAELEGAEADDALEEAVA